MTKAPSKGSASVKVTGKATGKAAGKAAGKADLPRDMPLGTTGAVGVSVDIADAAVAEFSSGRDALLEGSVPATLLPDSEEAFYARDPFSADYADFLKEKGQLRRDKAARVDEDLRADLLARPVLMERPEESTHRGAAAVWRSLRDQLKNESLAILDGSDPQELLMLQRELQARKMVLESVGKGIDGLLKRVEQRLDDTDAPQKTLKGSEPPQDSNKGGETPQDSNKGGETPPGA